MNEYDIEEAFAAIEEELIKSMMRNMKRHRVEEVSEGMEWSMWQAEQLKALEKYKKTNRKVFRKQFSYINNSIDGLISQARQQGHLDQEIEIMKAIKSGYRKYSIPGRIVQFISNNKGKSLREIIDILLKRNILSEMSGEFFRLNNRKLNALIIAVKQDFQKAEYAILRMAEDKYRKIIFDAQVYANSGAGTYEKAIDMATKDFLGAGINCIEYKNGARVNIASYAGMALRTASKRAYLTGEGEKRQEWGITTVIVNKRGAACPKCIPFVGKVFIDDVWSGGKPSDADYPLISTAIAKGLYHPNCKDTHTTYFEGITESQPPTREQVEKAAANYKLEQQQKYNERMVRKYKMLEDGSLDLDNKEKYQAKYQEWKMRNELFVKSHSELLRISPAAYNTRGLPLTNKRLLERLGKENRNYIDKYGNYRYNEGGNILVTDDMKNAEHYKILKEYKPYAVIETVEVKKGVTYVNRTIYDSHSRMIKQIHSGNHAQPKMHPYGNNGEHMHVYEWEDGRISNKTTKELTDVERKENGDIL